MAPTPVCGCDIQIRTYCESGRCSLYHTVKEGLEREDEKEVKERRRKKREEG